MSTAKPSGRWRERLRGLPRPSLSLLVAVAAVVGITVAISRLMGYSDVAIYMGLVALYVAMGAFGGSLRADLSVALLYAAGLCLFVAVPLWVAASVSSVLAHALFVLSVGACSLIPALGRRYGSVRLGLGLVVVYAFGYEITRNPAPSHVIVGSFVSLAILVSIRLLAAVPDPDGPLRRAVAAPLTDTSRTVAETAAATWLRGPSRAWTAEVLAGAIQYRAAAWAVAEREAESHASPAIELNGFVDHSGALAGRLAALVAARSSDPKAVEEARRDLEDLRCRRDQLDSEAGAASVIIDSLRRIVDAADTRDRTVIREARSIRRAAATASIRAALSRDSEYFRSALRSMVVVGAALLIVTLSDQPAYALPLLMGAYGVLQPTLKGSVLEARRRSVGVVIGAAVAAAIVATAGPTLTAVAAWAALAVAFAYIASSIAIFMGALVVTLTIAIAPVVGVDPVTYAIGYALAVILGASVAAVVGFVGVPRATPQRRQRALLSSISASASALQSIGEPSSDAQQQELLLAFRAQQNTAFATSGSRDQDFAAASVALGGLNMLALALLLGLAERTDQVDRTLSAVVHGLRGEAHDRLPPQESTVPPTAVDPVVELLRAEYLRLHQAMDGASKLFG